MPLKNYPKRTLTLRGFVASLADSPVSVFDYQGNDLTRGWKIIDFNCTDAVDPTSANKGYILHTDNIAKIWGPPSLTPGMSDNQIIGWCAGPTVTGVTQIDPNHVIVNSLYLSPLDTNISYLIILEEIKIDDMANVIYQLKERAQSSLE